MQQKEGATMQGNRQSKLLTRVFRVCVRLLATLATMYGALLLLFIVLIRVARKNKGFREQLMNKLVKPLDAVVLKIAGGRIHMYSLLKHVGRRSGRAYETPLGAWPRGDGFVFALVYGPDVDWCRNIMASGKCTLKWEGHEYALEKPEIIPISQAWEAYPLWARIMLVGTGTKQVLWVHRQREVPEKDSAGVSSLKPAGIDE
jgi:deazaflavin-dependent oxidoreductase (nitroreductase family)